MDPKLAIYIESLEASLKHIKDNWVDKFEDTPEINEVLGNEINSILDMYIRKMEELEASKKEGDV